MRNFTLTCIFAGYLALCYPTLAFPGLEGNPAPFFNLLDLKGTAVSLEQFKGKVVFLDFWATWCDACRKELPGLDRLYKKYGTEGLEVIGIAVDASKARVQKLFHKTPVSFTVLIDSKGEVTEAYRFSGLPAGYLIGRDGNIKKRYSGFSNDLLLLYEKDIVELLKHQ